MKDHGIVWVEYKGNKIRKPFVGFHQKKDKMYVYLTKGRDKNGKPIKGRKIEVMFWDIIEMPGGES